MEKPRGQSKKAINANQKNMSLWEPSNSTIKDPKYCNRIEVQGKTLK